MSRTAAGSPIGPESTFPSPAMRRVLSSLCALAVAALFAAAAHARQQPNIILFLVDDMGWEDTSVPFWRA